MSKSVVSYYHGNTLITKYLEVFYKIHTFIK